MYVSHTFTYSTVHTHDLQHICRIHAIKQHVMCRFCTQTVSIRTSGVALPIALSSVPGTPSEAWQNGQGPIRKILYLIFAGFLLWNIIYMYIVPVG